MEEQARDRTVEAAASSAELAAAVRRERERLAEALHDDALQRVMLAQQDLIEAEEEDDAGLRADVGRQLSELALSLRATTHAMHDRSLEELPLSRALERIAADGARRGRLAVTTVVAPEAAGVHDGLLTGLVRELLANVARHAKAANVAVTVAREGEAIVLRVRDDGRGIGEGELERAARSGHIGHARLRRTLAAVDGTIAIASAPGAGTTVECTLPIATLRAQRRLEKSLEAGRASGPRLARETLIPSASSAEAQTVVASVTALCERLEEARGEAALDRLLGQVARTVGAGLGWTVVICVGRPGEDALVARAAYGLDPRSWALARGVAFTREQWAPMLAARFDRGGAYLIPDGALGPILAPAESIDPGAWRDGDDLLVPFHAPDGRLLGVISLEAPVSGRRPTDETLEAIVAVAERTGRLVRRSYEAAASARHAQALAGLLRAAAELTAALDPETIPRRVAEAARDHLGFGRVVVEIIGADGLLRPVATQGREAAELEPLSGAELTALDVGEHLLLEAGRAETVLPAARRPLQRQRVGTHDPEAWDGHLLVVPLRAADGHAVGLIWLDEPDDGLLPTRPTLAALGSFADHAAAALIGARARARLAARSGPDELTQLPDRRAFAEELEREVARTARAGLASMLVLGAVEGCAALEEPSGHWSPAALEGLQEVVGAFRSELRLEDRAFRIDGGLFAVLLVGTERPPDTKAVMLRIAARLGAIGRGHGVSVHFGTAVIGPRAGSAANVLGRARRQLLDRRRTRT